MYGIYIRAASRHANDDSTVDGWDGLDGRYSYVSAVKYDAIGAAAAAAAAVDVSHFRCVAFSISASPAPRSGR